MKYIYAIVLCVCFVFSLSSCSDKGKKTKKQVEGYQGLAASNPYLLAQRFIDQQGYESEVSSLVAFEDPKFDTLIIPASAIQSRSQVEQVLAFVSSGGHVICLLENGEKNYRDFYGFRWGGGVEDRDSLEYLLGRVAMRLELPEEPIDSDFTQSQMQDQEMRAYPVPDSEDCILPIARDQELIVQVGGEKWIKDRVDPIPPSDSWEPIPYIGVGIRSIGNGNSDSSNHRFLSKQYNEGRLSVVSDARWLRNPHLAWGNHASFLKFLLELNGGQTVLISYGKSPHFFQLVWKYYPLVVIGLLLLFTLWVLSKMQRLGPVLEVVYQQPLNYLKSVEANGHFLWGRKKRHLLISSMQRRAVELLQLNGFDSEKENQLAEELNVDRATLVTALYSTEELEPTMFINSVKLLQSIINHHE